MCGIFGIILKGELKNHKTDLIQNLFALSMSRGSEASGLSIRTNGKIQTLKFPDSPKKFLQQPALKELFTSPIPEDEDFVCIGHTRMVTNGSRHSHLNNQPVYRDEIVLVHNGIVCNHKDLWSAINQEPQADLDSEVIASFIASKLTQGKSIHEATLAFYDVLEGDASFGMIFEKQNKMVLASNTGSLYYSVCADGSLIFASEKGFLQSLYKKYPQFQSIKQVTAKDHLQVFDFNQRPGAQFVDKGIRKLRRKVSDLKRCTKCVLPETFPNIKFNGEGVCNICLSYIPKKPLGADYLRQLCDKHRKNDGSSDCLLAFSGGRDSSYALHYLKVELGMNPTTITYDWGLVTDLARRNISRMCGKLGVENILVSADIPKKRKYVKLNLDAWLKKPELGMVTLLMAGDKEFFYHPQRVQKELNLDLTFFASNSLEQSNFKSAFCGVKESNTWYSYINPFEKFKMLKYFFLRYLENPAYINSSILDVLYSFYYAYIMKHDFHVFYDYLPWDEQTIDSTLQEHYNWEREAGNDITWRIGDGTSAFYNYIYLRLAGFSENDTFRSNQIRHGIISRDEALAKLPTDNFIRYNAMEFYAKTIGFDLQKVIDRIEGIASYE